MGTVPQEAYEPGRMKAIVLLIDDDPVDLAAGRILLESSDYGVLAVRSGQEGLDRLRTDPVDVVVSDLCMPGLSGEAVVEAVRRNHPDIPVIVVTGHGDIPSAVRAMKLGAFDFITKPVDPEVFIPCLERAVEHACLRRENASLRAELGITAWIGTSPSSRDLLDLVGRVSETDSTILIEGETGTGKELVARMIHYRSRRAAKPLIAVNCAALNPNVIESELFGHEKGAFTGAVNRRYGRFEEADGGTLFLDEISEISLDLQAKLLRVLQEGTFERLGNNTTFRTDVRIIASTNRPLAQWIRDGRFREDLYYRLNVIPVRIPPLRERREDIPLLAAHFAARYGMRYRNVPLPLAPDAVHLLQAGEWKGNVRELQHAIERAVVLAAGSILTPVDFRFPADPEPVGTPAGTLQAALDRTTAESIAAALTRTQGHKQHAAEWLGIDRATLYRLMKRHGVDYPPPGP